MGIAMWEIKIIFLFASKALTYIQTFAVCTFKINTGFVPTELYAN